MARTHAGGARGAGGAPARTEGVSLKVAWGLAGVVGEEMLAELAVFGLVRVVEQDERQVEPGEKRLAIGETVILLHPPLPLVGVSTWMERGCQ